MCRSECQLNSVMSVLESKGNNDELLKWIKDLGLKEEIKVYNIMIDSGIDSIDILNDMEVNDINEIVNENGLKIGDKTKLRKALMNKIDGYVIISTEEKKYMDKIKNEMESTKSIIKCIDDDSKRMLL